MHQELRRTTRVLEISLRKPLWSLLFMFAVSGASLLLAAEISVVGIVSSFDTVKVGRWLLPLDPDDAQLQHRLWQVQKNRDPGESLRHLRLATELGPYSRLYWDDLATVCEAVGDAPCAGRAIEQLLKLAPKAPFYHQLAAESYLRSHRLDDSVAEFRRLVELDPKYAPSVWVSLTSDVDPDPHNALTPDAIFQTVLADPIEPAVQVSYVDFLSARGDNDAAFRIWELINVKKLVATDVDPTGDPSTDGSTDGQSPSDPPQPPGPAAHRPSAIRLLTDNPSANGQSPIPFASVEPYLDRLIGLGRIEEAVTVWGDLERLGTVSKPSEIEKFAASWRDDNLVFNGDFEQFPMNAGFDWHWSGQLTYLAVDFSAPAAYHGARCLRIDFTVSRNQEYAPVYQIVPVLPNHAYRVEAYVRSEDITSDTGPSLRVSDTRQPGFLDAISDTTVGTTPWHAVRVYFSTGRNTNAVRLSLWRPLGRVFPTEITGSFWLDRVSLECLDR